MDRMTDRNELERWIWAERAGRENEAERLLRSSFRRLPQWTPSPGFVDRVLRRLAGLRYVWLTAPAGRFLKVAAGIGVVSGGLGAWLFLPATMSLAGAVSLDLFLDLGSAVLVATVRGVAELLGMIQALVRISSTLETILSVPSVVAVMVVCALLSSGALRWLQHLMADRSTVYVDSA